MLTDAVYPLGTGSLLDNEEIRYSLRSLLANAENLGNVYVIGEKPSCLEFGECLVHISYTERHRPYRNVWEKLRVAALDERISERFIFMNDDIYLVKKCDSGNIPHYSRGGHLGGMKSSAGPLGEARIADITNSYHRVMKHTLTALRRRSLTSYTFSTHQPVNFEKAKVLEVYKEFEEELQAPYGLSFRCCYGNLFGIDRIVRPTFIVKREWRVPAGRLAFASHRDVDGTMLVKKLSAMFPGPSVFEKP